MAGEKTEKAGISLLGKREGYVQHGAGRIFLPGKEIGWKNQKGCRKSAGLVPFDGFPDNFSFSGSRFADTSLEVAVGRTRQSAGGQSLMENEAKRCALTQDFAKSETWMSGVAWWISRAIMFWTKGNSSEHNS